MTSCPFAASATSSSAETTSHRTSTVVPLSNWHKVPMLLRSSYSAAQRRDATSRASSHSLPIPQIQPTVLPQYARVAVRHTAHSTSSATPGPCCGISALVRRHREPSSHTCTPPSGAAKETVPEKNAAAKALLAKHFGSSTTSGDSSGTRPSAAKPPNPKREEQLRKIAAMKMRQKAQPGNPKDSASSVPMDQRLHLKVSRTGVSSSERSFWFNKVTLSLALHHVV